MSRKARKFKAFFRPKLGDLQKKRSSPKFRVIFWPNSEIQSFFPPKKKVFAKIQSDFLAGIRNSKLFSAQNKVISKKKKKKGLRQNCGCYFVQFRKFRRLRGGCFRIGGAIFHFSQKIGLKSTKSMRFCILYKPMGGARAPPAPPWLRYCCKVCKIARFWFF